MIIDCFPYFNEKELLELRIKLLQDKVDKFIITEADRTHSGQPKHMTFLETLRGMKDIPLEKIFYLQVALPSREEEPNDWVRERMQRDAAGKHIKEDDYALVSDLDEIMNPDFIEYYVSIAKNHKNNVLRLPLVFLCSRADMRVYNEQGNPVSWSTPFIASKHHLNKYSLSDIRESHSLSKNNLEYGDIFVTENGVMKEAGWHFTWMGNETRRQTKKNAFAHWHEVQLVPNYKAQNGSVDPLGRTDHILKKYDTSELPKLVYDLKNVKNFLLPDTDGRSILETLNENPFLSTDKNSVFYKRYPAEWPFLQHHSYIENFYEDYFKEYCDKQNKILEIGIDTGGSIALWHEYFKNSTVVALDIRKERLKPEYDEDKFERAVYAYVKDAYDPIFIDSLGMFDIIIDDGPHTYETQRVTVEQYLKKLNKGGILVIEDISTIEYANDLYNRVPNSDEYTKFLIDLREKDNRYDSIILAVKRSA